MTTKFSFKDYDIKFKDLLNEDPVEPTKKEYIKLKDLDQANHVLKFEAIEAKKIENKPLNRYTNIFPYDHNRIILEDPVCDSNYINGSYINRPTDSLKDFNPELRKMLDLSKYDNIKFIATQGPLSKTCEHHWQAIFDNDVDIIIMLTKLVEGSKENQNEKVKCEKYWPSISDQCQFDHRVRYGKFEILIVEEQNVRPNLVKSTLYLMDCESGDIHDEKIITHFQYTGWPDFGAPEDTFDIINLVKDVREFIKQNNEKEDHISILTHCSAGVGRTGTFLALYKIMEEIDEKLEMHVERTEIKKRESIDPLRQLNIFKTVLSLRTKRVEMVQSFAQYKYLHACVADYLREVNRMYTMVDDYLAMQYEEEQ